MDWIQILLLVVAAAVLLLHPGHVFTRKLPAETDPKAPAHIVAIVRYGYVWIFVLLGCVLLFFVVPAERGYALSEDAAIQVVKGCRAADLAATDDQPREECVEDTAQWWLNIGGLSERQGEAAAPATKELDQAIAALTTAREEVSSLTPEQRTRIEAARAALESLLQDSQQRRLAQAIEAMKTVRAQVSGLTPEQRQQIETAEAALEALPKASGQFVISGGLSVPLYMIILALVGGLISMTRRIPEIQKRGSEAYKTTYKKCIEKRQSSDAPECEGIKAEHYPLEPERVREYVIFQMMQAVTAPLIATAAYALFELESTASVVAIGFVSGFASEPILLQIRKAAETITGESKPPATSEAGAGGAPEAETDATKSGISTEPKDPDEAAQIARNAADKAKN